MRVGIGILFLGAGIIHFTYAKFFDQFVPAALQDYRSFLNAITGVMIFTIGISFLVPRLRVAARWSAIPLLVVTLPGAIDQVIHPAALKLVGLTPTLAAARVLVQLSLIVLIWWATKPMANDRNTARHGTAPDVIKG